MKRYRSRGPKKSTMEGVDIALWAVFGIPMLIIWVIGALLGGVGKRGR